jgi:hypothetical protein
MENLDSPVFRSGLSRRDLLKRGAVVGAVAWTVPLISIVGMSPAHADSLSGTTPVTPVQPGKPVVPVEPGTPPQTGLEAANGTTPVKAGPAKNVARPASAIGAGGQTAPTVSALPNTGTPIPAKPAAIIGAGAVAIGAGLVAASRINHRDGDEALSGTE